MPTDRRPPFWMRKLWNRTRYYWPQAQSRRRATAHLRTGYAKLGIDWKPARPWWLP